MPDPYKICAIVPGLAIPIWGIKVAGWLTGAISLSFALFAFRPNLDLEVSSWFFQPGIGFPAVDDARLLVLRSAIWGSSQAMVALALVAIAVNFGRGKAVLQIPTRAWGFVLVLYMLGPGVMVELLLKPIWGRARPANTLLFGGDQPFSSPIEFVDHCSWNCSFVSGEVSGATALSVSLAIILAYCRPRLWPFLRMAVGLFILLAPVASAFQRVSAGRHFLSDALLALLFTLLLALILALALRLKPTAGSNDGTTGVNAPFVHADGTANGAGGEDPGRHQEHS